MSETKISPTTRVGFVSLGCPKNLVDSEIMLGVLSERGYEITPDQESADVIVVNTCGFIDSAKEESIDTILEMARLKDEGQLKRLVVAGCLAERYREEIRDEIPEIDFVFGPDELGRVLEGVQIDEGDTTSHVSIDALYTSREVPTMPRVRTTPPHLSYMKVSEGCDHTCTFCAIPGFRGAFRSRTLRDLRTEAERLAEDGVSELIIVSQDTLAYGKDIGIHDGIVQLLESLLSVEGLDWIRLLYCYPNLLSERVMKLIAREDRLCNYFDVPYQHASTRVLERMRRGGNRATFQKQVERMRETVPAAGLRSSFIVGFPGETEDDFSELLGFVGDVRFDNLGVFVYSDEEGTAAFELDSKVPRELALERRSILMERQADLTKQGLRRFVGQQIPVLLDGLSTETDLLLEGRMESQAPEIDGKVLINETNQEEPPCGQFYLTEITDSLDYDLVGRILKRL